MSSLLTVGVFASISNSLTSSKMHSVGEVGDLCPRL